MRAVWKYILLFVALEAVPLLMLVELHLRPSSHDQQSRRAEWLELSLSEESPRRPLGATPEIEQLLND